VLRTPVLLSEALLAHDVCVYLERPSGALPPESRIPDPGTWNPHPKLKPRPRRNKRKEAEDAAQRGIQVPKPENPRSETGFPRLDSRNLKVDTRNPEPGNSKPGTRIPKPETGNLEPGTRKPETRNLEPGTRNPEKSKPRIAETASEGNTETLSLESPQQQASEPLHPDISDSEEGSYIRLIDLCITQL